MTQRYTDDQIRNAVTTVNSKAQVLIALGLAPRGGNYKILTKNILRLGLDTSHFTGQASNRGKVLGPKKSIEEYLSNRQTVRTCHLKKRLIHENILEHKCFVCQNTIWNGEPIPLELHHIDGNSYNNTITKGIAESQRLQSLDECKFNNIYLTFL